MTCLYRGYRIEVTRMGEGLHQRKRQELALHYCITRLRDGLIIIVGTYAATWKVGEAITACRAELDLMLGILDDERLDMNMEAEMALEEGDAEDKARTG